MWNSTTLIPPPTNTFKAKKMAIDLKAVTVILQNAIDTLKSQRILYTESPILSRCVYRMKLKFRQDKGFKFMEKTNKLLKLLTQFNLIHDLTSFLNTMPIRYERDLYLPTKQMIEYILVRMQGYAKLLCRIVESSVATADYMKWRLNLGHFWTTAAVVIAIISRVWYLCKYFTQKCCQWFNDLLPLRDKLDINGVQWLPDDYEFPEDLAKWLDVDWLRDESDVILKPQFDLPVYSLMNDSDDEEVKFCYEYNLNDCFVIDDDKTDDTDVEFVANYKNTKVELDRTINISETDSDIEMLNSYLNTECHDENDVGEVIAREDSVICVDDESSSNTNQNNASNQNELQVVDITNSSKRKRKRTGKMVRDRGKSSQNDEDIGVTISREDNITVVEDNSDSVWEITPEYISLNNNNPNTSTNDTPNKKKRKKNAANKNGKIQSPQSQVNINNIQDLNNFLKNECTRRKSNLKECVTRNLKEKQWNVLFNKLNTIRMHAEKKQKLRKNLLKQARKLLTSLK